MKYLLGEKLQFDSKVVWVSIISTLLLIVDYYHAFLPHKYLDRLILYFVIPLFIILVFFRESPKEYGFSLGDWKLGLIYTVIGVAIMAPVIYIIGSDNSSMQSYYLPYLIGQPWTTFLDLLGWEFFFRGWILFTYARKFGPDALWIHAVPFALAHLTKPEVETLSTIFGGFAFGWIGYRTKSFVWPLLIHWFIGSFIVYVAAGVV